MRLQILVSAVDADVRNLPEKMNIQCDAIIINQTSKNEYDEFEFKGNTIKAYSFAEKGVGLSRNSALLRADGDILLFSDEDIVYDNGYADKILSEFDQHKDADMLLFNMRVGQSRATYYNTDFHRIHIWNAGRYPTYSFAVKREILHKANITFSLLFGGGAKYSNGEDSLFLKDCIKYGMTIYAVTPELGQETERESTWFKGYTEKFFYDRGYLYHFLYGWLALAMAWRFILAHGSVMCQEIPKKQAIALMKKGIKDAR